MFCTEEFYVQERLPLKSKETSQTKPKRKVKRHLPDDSTDASTSREQVPIESTDRSITVLGLSPLEPLLGGVS